MDLLRDSNQLQEAHETFWDRMIKRRTLKALFLHKERSIIDRETIK
jgi:hypothetical protein